MSNLVVGARQFDNEKQTATRKWVENHRTINSDDLEDDMESVAESSVVESDSDNADDFTSSASSDLCDIVATKFLGMQVSEPGSTFGTSETDTMQQLMKATNSVQTVGNVNIENSTNVHIGNITNINGDIHIHTGEGIKKLLKRKTRQQKNTPQQPQTQPKSATFNDDTHREAEEQQEECEERVSQNVFINKRNAEARIPKNICSFIPRVMWLAQSPMEDYKYMSEPVKYVIISHTATEESVKQATNILIIRHIQCFHIESKEWNDIAYNFLVGCDGNIYEGRGWAVVGAHTLGYNANSMGIAFVGCFMRQAPSKGALNACKSLLKRGVAEGHLAPDYKLLAACHCRSTESPGRKLLEEIEKWDNFFNLAEEEDIELEDQDN